MSDGRIDLHTHWYSPRALELLAARSEPPRIVETPSGLVLESRGGAFGGGDLALSPSWFDLDARLVHLDEHGISHQLISWPTTVGVDVALGAAETLPLWEAYNEDLGELVRARPERFSGLAALSTSDIAWSVRELRRAHEELGLIGGVLPVGSVASLEAAKQFAPLFATAQELGSLIYLHTGWANAFVSGQPPLHEHGDTQAIRRTLDVAAHFAHGVITLAYTDFLDAYPDVAVQIGLLGGAGVIALIAEQVRLTPRRLGEFDIAQRYRNIYLDTGAAGRGSEAIGAATRVFGARQIVFGTDYGPFESVAQVIDNVEAAPISAQERRLIYSENARRLLGGRVPALAA